MAIKIQDIIDDGLTLEVYCRACGKIVLVGGARLLGQFGTDTPLATLVPRLCCKKDGMPGEVRLLADTTAVRREAHIRGLALHTTPPRLLPDIDHEGQTGSWGSE